MKFNLSEVAVPRVQLALNVSNLKDAIGFYTKLFDTEPAKVRPGYANFAIAPPPLKLVLIEGGGEPGSINHLGVEVEGAELVSDAQRRLADEGLHTASEEGVACCYAIQDKVWVDGPDDTPWEIYTVLADADVASAAAGGGGFLRRLLRHAPDLAAHARCC